MCGIIGYVGEKSLTPILMEGLRRLEYRGYDSAGLAVVNGEELKVVRRQGNLNELAKAIQNNELKGSVGIGHTRWATHGRPSESNAHPHTDCNSKIAVVHNGIVENFLSLREELQAKGHVFKSETDTEIIAHLIEENYQGELAGAVRKSLKFLEGSFALAVICKDHPRTIVAARKDSPLILGIGQREYFVASDIPAVLNHTREVLILEDGEMAVLDQGGVKLATLDNNPVNRETLQVTWDTEAAEKSGYEDFMLKEIFEQPMAVKETMRGRFFDDGRIVLDEIELSEDKIRELNKVFVVACGTSYHAGLVARQAIERWVGLPVEIDISSEFRYRDPVLDQKTLVIAITQSGETTDTIAAVREARQRAARVMAVSNVVGSSVTREADGVIYTHAGPEIGVAATKTLSAQMVALYVLALYLAQARGSLPMGEIKTIVEELKKLPAQVESVLERAAEIRNTAVKFASSPNFLFLGRGIGYPVALEGALKLKEISYIHAEGCAAGEMKHGPIALIEKGVPVVVVATKGHTYDKIVSNIQEVIARDATVIAVATEGDDEIKKYANHVFYVPKTSEILSAVTAVVPLQLFAYYIAKKRGCNVDQPRNLAKSVTVE